MAYLLLQAWSQQHEFCVTWIGAAGSVRFPNLEFIAWKQMDASALSQLLQTSGWDLIHNDGAFSVRSAGSRAPVLFTLHLARSLYDPDLFASLENTMHFQCVSRSQSQSYGPAACCGYVANGIDLDQFPVRRRSADHDAPLLYLGRICPEKAPHLAIRAARCAQRRLWLVGAVAPFPAHQSYFHDCIAPELDTDIRWLPPPPLERKRELLQAAAALVVPSQIGETSSIAAMEAAASGLPVLATRQGALPEIIADGETGWLGSCEDFPDFVHRLDTIRPEACRERAERLFSSRRMIDSYASLYRRLGEGKHGLSPKMSA